MSLHPTLDAAALPTPLPTTEVAALASVLVGAAAVQATPAGPPGDEWLAALAATVAEAARHHPGLDGHGRAAAPGGRADDGWADGAGTCLLRTPAVEVRVVRWAVGQGTYAHDHGGAASAIAVIAGELVEDRFEPPLWRAERRRRRLRAGTVVTLPTGHTHVVANPGPGPASSIHVVSPPALPAQRRSVGADTFLAELCPPR